MPREAELNSTMARLLSMRVSSDVRVGGWEGSGLGVLGVLERDHDPPDVAFEIAPGQLEHPLALDRRRESTLR